MSETASSFDLAAVSLPKEYLGSGAYCSAARFYDFMIDGMSLRATLGTPNVGVISDDWDSSDLARQLIGEMTIDQRLEGRSLIYGCRECLDVDCGGITVKVSRTGATVQWKDFEEFWSDPDGGLVFAPIDATLYRFDAKEYRAALERFISSR